MVANDANFTYTPSKLNKFQLSNELQLCAAILKYIYLYYYIAIYDYG